MTDRTRELLERALGSLDAFYGVGGSFLGEEIRAYLAQPEVKREALSEDEINREMPMDCSGGFYDGFYSGVRFAEKHHGISSTIPSLNDTISANSRNSGHE